MVVLVLFGGCLIAADGAVEFIRNDSSSSVDSGGGRRRSPRQVFFDRDVNFENKSGTPRARRAVRTGKGFSVDAEQSRVVSDGSDRDESGKDNEGAIHFDPEQARKGLIDTKATVKPAAKSVALDFSSLRTLKTAFESEGYKKNVYPLLKKICDIDELTKIVNDAVDAQKISDEIVERMNALLKQQKSFAEIKGLLAKETITLQMQKALLDFIQTCKPLLDLIMKRDPVMDEFVKEVAKELPLRSLENLLSTSMSRVSESNYEISEGMAQFLTILTLIALSTSLAALLIALGNKFHVKGLTDVGVGIIVLEVVIVGGSLGLR